MVDSIVRRQLGVIDDQHIGRDSLRDEPKTELQTGAILRAIDNRSLKQIRQANDERRKRRSDRVDRSRKGRRLADQMLPSCVTVTVCPPMVTVPVRDGPLLADAVITTPPLPVTGFV
jgi:hypothetical protein